MGSSKTGGPSTTNSENCDFAAFFSFLLILFLRPFSKNILIINQEDEKNVPKEKNTIKTVKI